jgi:hypothetical protein
MHQQRPASAMHQCILGTPVPDEYMMYTADEVKWQQVKVVSPGAASGVCVQPIRRTTAAGYRRIRFAFTQAMRPFNALRASRYRHCVFEESGITLPADEVAIGL